MPKPQAVGIYREIKLAGKPGVDQRILELTGKELKKKGFDVSLISSSQFIKEKVGEKNIDLIFTMARDSDINEYLLLIEKQRKDIFIINSPLAIRFSFNNTYLNYERVKAEGVFIPEMKFYDIEELTFSDLGGRKVLLKPANRHEYWFEIEKEFHFEAAMEIYKKQGIKRVIIQKFIEGRDLKFYAIGEDIILPKDIKSLPKETIKKIKEDGKRIGKVTGLKVFGGDYIIDINNDYKPYCVDINDWPSFGGIEGFTQEEAALKIASLIEKEFKVF